MERRGETKRKRLLEVTNINGVETVLCDHEPLAHIYRRDFIESSKGINFLTPQDYPVQVGVLNHPEGHRIKDHTHNPDIEYRIDTTQEFLYVQKGKMLVKIFSSDLENEPLTSFVIEGGDAILLVGGGHGFEMIEETTLLEVKQGPYYEKGPWTLKKYREDLSK